MKKRIVAILLVLSILVMSLSHTKRAFADPGTVAVVGFVCVAAVSVMQFVTSGAYKEVAEDLVDAIEYTGESFKYVFYGTDVICESTGEVIYHEDGPFLEFVKSIASGFQDMFDSGELVKTDSGNWQVKGKKLKELISSANQSIGVMARPKVDFTAGYNCTFLDVDLSKPFTLKSLPTMSEFLPTGESYAAVYFDENRIIFSSYYLLFIHSGLPTDSTGGGYSPYCLLANLSPYYYGLGSSTNFGTLSDLYSLFSTTFFSMLSLSSFSYIVDSQLIFSDSYDYCFVYESGTVTRTPISEVDVTGMNSGLITTTGNYGDFLKSIDDYSIGTTTVPKLDDLDVVPDDATVSFPVNPDKEISIPEQVGVSIPGVGDTTLAQLQGDLNLDIDIPSVIIDKFPFCIPFDFVRFLGILCADPVAPVFRIPISTHPDNLDDWTSNQTFGDYINPDSPPLFEIDEEIVIDLSHIPLVQPICYTCFIVGFIFLLLHITPKMIQH